MIAIFGAFTLRPGSGPDSASPAQMDIWMPASTAARPPADRQGLQHHRGRAHAGRVRPGRVRLRDATSRCVRASGQGHLSISRTAPGLMISGLSEWTKSAFRLDSVVRHRIHAGAVRVIWLGVVAVGSLRRCFCLPGSSWRPRRHCGHSGPALVQGPVIKVASAVAVATLATGTFESIRR
jgi:hypothetical protein